MKKLKIFLLIATACAVLGLAITSVAHAAQLPRYNFTVVDESGVAIGSNKVVVTVYNAGTTTRSTLYTNTNGDSALTGAFTTDTGDISFYGGAGAYDIVITDSPLVTTQNKYSSVVPTTHRLTFAELRTLSPVTIIGKLQTLVDSDTQPVVTSSYVNTNTTTASINNFLFAKVTEVGLQTGQYLVVVSKGAITFDVTSSGLIGGSTDIITASGDTTTWMYDGTDWRLLSFVNLSTDQNSN